MAKNKGKEQKAKSHGSSTGPAGRHCFGWVPDLPDARDLLYAAPMVAMGQMQPQVDLTAKCPPVYDQGQLGSCTGNAIAAAYQYDELKQAASDPFMPSRLFIYYNERAMEGTVSSDSGAQIRDGIKSIGKQGVCPEKMWPYDIAKFASKAPAACYQSALQNRAILYRRVPRDLTQMRSCLAEGFPWVFGVTVYDSFESQSASQSGDISLPNTATEKVLGGHAILAVGYDDDRHVFRFRNSWGIGWGNQGYGTIPYSYLLDANLSDDFWTVRLVQGGVTS
ncbi:MAG: peptidase [Phycisphaerales bacterium]|nr:peptidase [Phycisphaerales bacterium]